MTVVLRHYVSAQRKGLTPHGMKCHGCGRNSQLPPVTRAAWGPPTHRPWRSRELSQISSICKSQKLNSLFSRPIPTFIPRFCISVSGIVLMIGRCLGRKELSSFLQTCPRSLPLHTATRDTGHSEGATALDDTQAHEGALQVTRRWPWPRLSQRPARLGRRKQGAPPRSASGGEVTTRP